MAENDELSGDSVSSDMGERGEGNLVGKHLTQRNQQQRVEITLPDLGGRNPTLTDLYNVIAYNQLTGEPGLVGKVGAMDRRLTTVESEVVVVKEKVSAVDSRTINIENLVNKRNIENRDKVHMSLVQFVILIVVVFVVASFIAPWLWRVASGGVLDGDLGLSIFLRGAGRYYLAHNSGLCLVTTAARCFGFCSGLGAG